MVVRGYLTGSMGRAYARSVRTFCGVDVPDVAVGQLPLDHPARIGVGEVELRAQCPRQLHSGQHDHFRLTRGNPDHDRMPRKRGYP